MNKKPIADRLDAIEARLAAIETNALANVRLGPNPKQDAELEADRERIVKQIVESAKQAQPVDRSCRVLVSGNAVPEDNSHTELKENGQQEDYVVLCDSERAKGFVRPVRRSYKHLKCGSITTMSQSIAETYARDPGFYSGTFCVGCGGHYPIETYGQTGEFVWLDDGSKLGS